MKPQSEETAKSMRIPSQHPNRFKEMPVYTKETTPREIQDTELVAPQSKKEEHKIMPKGSVPSGF